MGSEAIPVFLAITARQNLQIVDMTVGQNIFYTSESRKDGRMNKQIRPSIIIDYALPLLLHLDIKVLRKLAA